MKIAIMGSGGLGGYFGARLAQGGAEVHFIARGAHLAAMRASGLRVEGAEPLHLAEARASDDPASVGPCDLVLIAVKLGDTEAALRAIAPLVGPDTTLVSFQNGVAAADLLRAAYPRAHILGGVGYIAASVARPGVIRQTGTMQRLVFGDFDGARSKPAEAFLAACEAGGVRAEISPDIRRAIWEKYVFLVGLSGATTAMRRSVGPIRWNPRTRAFLLDLMREVVAVGLAKGVALDPGYAEQRLAFIDGLPAETTSSMSHDLEAGKPLELPWLAGGVVELGREAGVPTPLNRAVADILALHAGGREPARTAA